MPPWPLFGKTCTRYFLILADCRVFKIVCTVSLHLHDKIPFFTRISALIQNGLLLSLSPEENMIFIYMGDLSERRNTEPMLKCFCTQPGLKTGPYCCWVKLHRTAERWAVPNIIFRGPVEEIRSAYPYILQSRFGLNFIRIFPPFKCTYFYQIPGMICGLYVTYCNDRLCVGAPVPSAIWRSVFFPASWSFQF